ncbi:class II aldolase/adducin family protein [Canibacter zhoujuaniae]|uniref:class II aldolase/adducin family protein n=1 Tax=Canibacter zhoujuaniae TaxID=2708343 RepID=UPI0014228E30|nr:class II aldolase/adducin family protein [Canibacter zhoujuaniae]
MKHDETLLDELIAVGADAARRGLVLASAGNFSVRLSDDTFAITGSGVWFDRLSRADFATMNLTGEHLRGVTPSSEWRLHREVYKRRPDVKCVLHLHPEYATLLPTLGHKIRLLTLDHAFYAGEIGVTEFYPNGSDALAETAAAELETKNCVIMKHHGCSVVADTVEMAYRRALNLEGAARMSFNALQLQDSETVFPDGAAAHHA